MTRDSPGGGWAIVGYFGGEAAVKGGLSIIKS